VRLFDSHCHLDVAEFDADRDAVLARAAAAGVDRLMIPAIDAAHWPGIRSLCAGQPGLYPAYGLHPLLLDQHRPEHLDQLADWLAAEPRAAIGECGLDFYVDGLDPDRQRQFFQRQIELAREFDRPLVLHARRAVEEVTLALRRIGGLRGVVHSFSGSEEQARQLFELGFSIGVGGPVTYERARRLRRIVASMPLEFLLLETDAPDQPDAQHRGQRNEPARLVEVLHVVAELRGVEVEVIAAATTANAERLFAMNQPAPCRSRFSSDRRANGRR
jgi:TatD DNase family protein